MVLRFCSTVSLHMIRHRTQNIMNAKRTHWLENCVQGDKRWWFWYLVHAADLWHKTEGKLPFGPEPHRCYPRIQRWSLLSGVRASELLVLERENQRPKEEILRIQLTRERNHDYEGWTGFVIKHSSLFFTVYEFVGRCWKCGSSVSSKWASAGQKTTQFYSDGNISRLRANSHASASLRRCDKS